MGLLDNVKRTLNIGGATVTIVTDSEVPPMFTVTFDAFSECNDWQE